MNKYFNFTKLLFIVAISTSILFPAHLFAAGSNPRYLDNIVQVSTGGYHYYYPHTLALDKQGVVWAWGENNYGQLGNGIKGYNSAAIPVIKDVIKIATSDTNSFAVKNDGTVWMWGKATGLQGNGTLNSYSSPGITDFVNPTAIKALSDVVDIKAGITHVLALKSDGTVWSWGSSTGGKLGRSEWKESTPKAFTPMKVPGLQKIKTIYAGNDFSAATDEAGTTWAWGTLSSYFNVVDRLVSRWEPVKLFDFPIKEIDDFHNRIYVTKTDGTFWEVQKSLEIKPIMGDVLSFKCHYTGCLILKTSGEAVKFSDVNNIEKHGLVINPLEIKQIDFNYSTMLLKMDGTVQSYGPISANTGNETINDTDYKKYANVTEEMVNATQLRTVWKAITLKLNGNELKLPTNPIIINGVSFLPLRGVIEQMGGHVQYDSGNITISSDNDQLKLQIRTTAASKNGQNITLSSPPLVIRGTTMVPLRFVSEGLGASVNWDEKNRLITIKSKK
ncbi:stalk domain-containing protein [Paenibacillus luteus]|uniref:stalk domain-containing protein n=1 Tax=Paenibacillus luteus TaxID=2545753 RepID=UPI001142C947|nr:stalk domain-containing protein [Paenibacillus luteus]